MDEWNTIYQDKPTILGNNMLFNGEYLDVTYLKLGYLLLLKPGE